MNSFKVIKDEMYNSEDLQTLYSTLFITLLTTRVCNLNCEYCDVIYRDKLNTKMVSIEEFNKLIEFILYQKKSRPNINLHFFGGEPTLNPSLIEFINIANDRLDDYNLNMIITTNLTRSEVYYEKIENVKIVGSFHSKYISDHSSWHNKAKSINKAGKLHHAVLMVTLENMDFIYDLYKEWSKDFKCILVPIDQVYKNETYINFRDKILSDGTHNPFEHDEEYKNYYDADNPQNGSFGIMCSSGLLVDEFGDVSMCFPRLNEKMYNIFNNPEITLNHFHFCNKLGKDCDMEIIRSSILYYNRCLKNRIYTVNNKVLVQCNA